MMQLCKNMPIFIGFIAVTTYWFSVQPLALLYTLPPAHAAGHAKAQKVNFYCL
jgi:hypothetical protein